MSYPLFPFMINICEREILIIGGGYVASRRAKTLIKCGAKVIAISPDFRADFPKKAVKIFREFKISDIDSKFLFVIAATNNREINRFVHDLAKAKSIPVNVADSQNECDFFFPSLINCESLGISVNSAGKSAALTKKISDRLRKFLPIWIREENGELD